MNNEDLETIIREVYSCYDARYGNAIVDLKQRIDKAIEYIKQYGNLYCLKDKQFKDYQQYKDLLDILKGSDKE